ncbi:adhesin transport system outer membrane protein [Kushneria sinocarnis]|uniref:Adhesin transport system outer membrane protein n=1 Tax=Kushneria sinocarnis TaxID=595502 RepID=A0A420WZU6_9GAMM|nr:TolC family outer membrane protein [Kushneria sinocarnis]RKR06871.1 adhesin transport system outer membrane protein [Kushneria sinocarnis]
MKHRCTVKRWSWLLGSQVQAQTLTEAVTEAVREHPVTRTELSRYQQRLEEARAQKGAYLPSVTLEGRTGYGRQESEVEGVDQSSDPHDYQRGSITLSQLIWDGNRTVNRIRQANDEADYQRWQTASAANQIALSTVQAYLEVLLNQQLVELAERNVEQHQRTAADIRRRSEAGAGTTTDTSQVEGRLARARASLVAARNNLEDARSAYIRLVGEAPGQLRLPETVDMTAIPEDLERVMAMATANNPLLIATRESVQAAGHEVAAERGDFLPSFNVEASRLTSRDYDFEGSDADDWKAELVMRYNLYRGGSDLAELRARDHALEAVRHDSDRALREVRDELRLAWNARDYLRNELPYLEQHVDASEQTRTNYRKQFDIGRRTLLDLLDSENEVYDARRARLQAEFDLRRARYRLLAVTGQLLDSMRVNVRPSADGTLIARDTPPYRGEQP